MNVAAIYSAIMTRYKAGAFGIETVPPGVDVTPDASQAHARLYFIPASNGAASLGGTGLDVLSGILQIDLMYPGGDGIGIALSKADEVAAFFQRGQGQVYETTTTVVFRGATVLQPRNEDGWLRVPVSIGWYSHVERTVDAIPAPVDTDSVGYPLDDDGTLAAAFGKGFAAAASPEYHQITYIYSGAATGGETITAPTLANALGSQAVTVGAGKILGAEMIIKTPPVSAQYAVAYIAAQEISGGAPTGNIWAAGFSRNGSGGLIMAVGSGDTPPTGLADETGYRVGIDVNGTTGAVTLMWGKPGTPSTYGSVTSSGSAFTPGRKIAFTVGITDSGTTAAGKSIELWAIPNAADMQLTHTSGATDWNNVTI